MESKEPLDNDIFDMSLRDIVKWYAETEDERNLKFVVFHTCMFESDMYNAIKDSKNHKRKEKDINKAKADTAYAIIKEAGLEDEYNAWVSVITDF